MSFKCFFISKTQTYTVVSVGFYIEHSVRGASQHSADAITVNSSATY